MFVRREVWTGVAAVVAAIAMGGCQSPAGSATPPTAPPPSRASGHIVPASVVVEVRKAAFIPPGFYVQGVEFVDRDYGYAALWTTNPINLETAKDSNEYRYASALFATTDGGRTWTKLKDPRRPSPVAGLWVLDARTIVLETGEEGWYISRDGGATFRFTGTREPPELGEYRTRSSAGSYITCGIGCGVLVVDGVVQTPGLAGQSGVAIDAGGVVWTAAVDGATASSAFSLDRGRTWQRRDVPPHPIGTPNRLDLRVSADGRDVWMLGYHDETGGRVGAFGSTLPVRRKGGGFPLLWLFEGDRWMPKGTVNSPKPSPDPYVQYTVAAIGGGLAAVAGPDLFALVSDVWRTVDLTPRVGLVTTLPDGTVFGANAQHLAVYLGSRTGSEVRWVQLILDDAQ